MRDAIEKMAMEVADPFEFNEALMEVTAAAPPEMRAYIADELALSPNPMARAAVPPMLLDPVPKVKQAAAAALEQSAMPETMAPVSLRRIIAVRNWLPPGERAAVDRAIRKAREKGVQIAPWRTEEDVSIIASMIDGVGAQSVMIAGRAGRSGLFAADWKDRAIDPLGDTAELFAGLPDTERTEAAIAASLRRSEAWTRGNDVFAIWFEDNKEMHDLVASVPKRDSATALRLLLDRGFEKLRGP